MQNGTTILDARQKLDRWVELYSELYKVEGSSNHVYLNNLPNSPVLYHLDETSGIVFGHPRPPF